MTANIAHDLWWTYGLWQLNPGDEGRPYDLWVMSPKASRVNTG